MNAITNNYRFSFLISSFIQPSTIMVMSYSAFSLCDNPIIHPEHHSGKYE